MTIADTSSPSIFRRIFISPGERRLRAGWRLLGQSILFFILLLVFGIIAVLIQRLAHDGSPLIAEVASGLAITISVFVARRLLDRRSIKSLGLALNRRVLVDLLVGIIISGMMMGFIFLIEWAAGWLTIDGFAWQNAPTSQVVWDMLFMLVFFIVVGWQEELSSRGYQLQNLAEGMNLFWGVIVSSAMFAFLHLMNPSVSFAAIIGLLFSGLFLAYGYVTTRQLWLPIGLHIGWNFFESSIFGFQVSGYTGWPRLILQTVKGNSLLTGAEFGPEAGLVLLPGVLLGVLLVYIYTRDRDLNISRSSTD